MLKIALCDGNAHHVHEVKAALITILFDRIELEVSVYKDGVEVVEAARNKNFSADLIFLDINMENVINGLGVAKFIRKNNIDCDIIFLTASKEFILEGYKYSAFDYLLKPVSISTCI